MPKTDNIQRVAKEVIKQVESGELINVKKAMLAVGYAKQTAEKQASEIVKNSKYKLEVKKELDILQERQLEANEIMKNKAHKASYRDGLEALLGISKMRLALSGDKPSVQIQVNWSD